MTICFQIVVIDLTRYFGDLAVISLPEAAVSRKICLYIVRKPVVDFLKGVVVGFVKFIGCVDLAKKIAAVVEGGIVGIYTGEKTDKICFFLLHKSTQMRKLVTDGKWKIVGNHCGVIVCLNGKW